MSLLDLATKEMDSFDPKKDSVNNTNQGLPDGEYLVTVESIDHATFDSGWDCLQIVFTVLDGDLTSRKEYDRISFAEKTGKGNKIPDFVLSRNIKFVSKLGYLLGVEIKPEYFASENETDVHEALTAALAPEKGKSVVLKVKHTPNKKDPSNPYVNYDLEEAEQPKELEVSDDDLPTNLLSSDDEPIDMSGTEEVPF